MANTYRVTVYARTGSEMARLAELTLEELLEELGRLARRENFASCQIARKDG